MAKSKEIIEHEIRQLEQACQNSKEVFYCDYISISIYIFTWLSTIISLIQYFYLLKYT